MSISPSLPQPSLQNTSDASISYSVDMPTIDDLPEELLLEILRLAARKRQDRSLTATHALLVVNKRFHRLALPLLYRDLGPFDGEKFGPWNLKCLAKQLLLDPDRARLVHSVHVDREFGFLGADDERDDRPDPFSDLTDEEKRRIRALGDGCPEDLVKAIGRLVEGEGGLGVGWPLALATLPNIEELTFCGASEDEWLALDNVVEGLRKSKAENAYTPFRLLGEVTAGGDAPEYPDTTISLAVISKWPSVNWLLGQSTGDGDEIDDPEVLPTFMELEPASNNLQTLLLRPNCKLLNDHLYRLLGAPKALEYFDYHVGHISVWFPIDTAGIPRALAQQKHSLKHIILHQLDTETENEEGQWAPMDFSEFEKLEHLDISQDMLLGHDPNGESVDPAFAERHVLQALPRSIKEFSLVLAGYDPVFSTIGPAIIREKESRFPDLETLLLAHWGDGGESEWPPAVLELKREAAAKGVKLTARVCQPGTEDLVLQRLGPSDSDDDSE